MNHRSPPSDPRAALTRLLEIMAALRHPDTGCAWDRAQDFASIAPYTIEEAYEVVDAIERGDLAALRDELGDLLLQVVFHAQMAAEDGAFDFADVASAISNKMERRHPHVFAGAATRSPEEQRQAWEDQKARERDQRAAGQDGAYEATSILAGVARALPALMRAEKLQKRASRQGFDWDEVQPVIAKIEEELSELQAELPVPRVQHRLDEEIGDLLFACVNLARHVGTDAEQALRAANDKFERRFRAIEEELQRLGKKPADASLAEMDALWDAVKRRERGDAPKTNKA